MIRKILLEPEAEAVSNASAVPPRIYQMPPEKGREVLDTMQNAPVYKYPARIEKSIIDAGEWGNFTLYLVIPEEVTANNDVIYYIHGGGWVLGNFHTHEKLVRELAARTGCVVAFPEYSRSPEAKDPVAIEQCYEALCQLQELFAKKSRGFCEGTLTVAGDSVGGNMAIAMGLLSKYRQGPKIQKILLYYPVTNASFDTETYCEFAEDYYLYRDSMIWFWNQYAPARWDRNLLTASPLRASIEQLKGLPEMMILNGEADVLRDEGEDFAEKLRCAEVPVTALRFQAMIHDFVMLHALDQTRACRAAMDVSTDWIKRKNRIEMEKQERAL